MIFLSLGLLSIRALWLSRADSYQQFHSRSALPSPLENSALMPIKYDFPARQSILQPRTHLHKSISPLHHQASFSFQELSSSSNDLPSSSADDIRKQQSVTHAIVLQDFKRDPRQTEEIDFITP
jgi:hypothetical protein